MSQKDSVDKERGHTRTEFAPSQRDARLNRRTGVALGVAGLFLIGFAFLLSLETRFWVCVLPLGLLVIALGAWSYIRGRRQANLRVTLHDEGLEHTDGEDSIFYRWDEIEEIRQSSVQHAQPEEEVIQTDIYTLVDQKGKQTTLDDQIPDVQDLGETIQEEVSRRQLPEAIEAYEQSETVRFGLLHIDQAGIHQNDEHLEWERVEAVYVEEGMLLIRAIDLKQEWISLPTDQIANVPVFLALTRRCMEQEGRQDDDSQQ